MGCSSGKLVDMGDFDPYGTALEYMKGGCPMLVGNLWNVTDGDLDKFTVAMLKSWGLEEPKFRSTGRSICEAVVSARQVCRLRYLNGAAPVVYGIPAYLC